MAAAPTYRAKQGTVEAIQWTGHNPGELAVWTNHHFSEVDPEDREFPDETAQILTAPNSVYVAIDTGAWIVKGPDGFRAFSDRAFKAAYERA